MVTQHLSRGALADESGVNSETIRYYERAGLMPDPPRSPGGHRVYRQSHVKRLAFIRRCRSLGFSLQEIREFLALVDGGNYTCCEVLELTRSRISDVRMKIRDLKRMEATLKELAEQCSGQEAPECPIVDSLWQH